MSEDILDPRPITFPKKAMADIETYLSGVLEDKGKGRNPWMRWLDKWVSFYDRRFGPDWKNKDKKFWEDFPGLGLIPPVSVAMSSVMRPHSQDADEQKNFYQRQMTFVPARISALANSM